MQLNYDFHSLISRSSDS